jgi:hypothetical protein
MDRAAKTKVAGAWPVVAEHGTEVSEGNAQNHPLTFH